MTDPFAILASSTTFTRRRPLSESRGPGILEDSHTALPFTCKVFFPLPRSSPSLAPSLHHNNNNGRYWPRAGASLATNDRKGLAQSGSGDKSPGGTSNARIPVVVHMTESCTVAQLVAMVLSQATKPLASSPTHQRTTSSSFAPNGVSSTSMSSSTPSSPKAPTPVGPTLDTKEHEIACGHTTLCAANEFGYPDDDCPALDMGRAVHSFGVPTFLLVDRSPALASSSGLSSPNGNRWIDLSSLRAPPDIFIGPKNKRFLADPLGRLFHAAENGHLSVVRRLLESGFVTVNATGINNWTAMHFCARKGHLPVVNYLLKASANVEAVSKGSLWSALHAACYYGHTDAAETLLFHGAEVNLRCSAKLTPLDYARLQGHSELVELLTATFEAESGEGYAHAVEEKKTQPAAVMASSLSSHATMTSGLSAIPSGISLLATTSPPVTPSNMTAHYKR